VSYIDDPTGLRLDSNYDISYDATGSVALSYGEAEVVKDIAYRVSVVLRPVSGKQITTYSEQKLGSTVRSVVSRTPAVRRVNDVAVDKNTGGDDPRLRVYVDVETVYGRIRREFEE
jgi:hypothetical protein